MAIAHTKGVKPMQYLQIILVGVGVPIFTLLFNRWCKVHDEKNNKESAELKAINEWKKDVKNDIKRLENKLDKHIEMDDERNAIQIRVRIQRFDSDLRQHGFDSKTKEEYEQFFSDCKAYNLYCDENPNFRNQVTHFAEKHAEECYKRCLMENVF